MPSRRSAATMERDHKAYDLFRRGLSYRQIAKELDVSHQTAFDAVRRASRDNGSDPLEQAEARQAALDRLQDYRRAAWRVLTARHYVVSQGGTIVLGPDGKPLADNDPVLRALDRLVKIDQEDNRLRDLYPPAKARVEVITDDAVSAEIRDLAEQIARNDAEAATAGPGPA
jgi:transposase-like protein